MTDLRKLRARLARELAHCEQDALLRTTHEARRLGEAAPAAAMRAIAEHCGALRPRFEWLLRPDHTLGLGLGRALGQVVSALRHALFGRLIDTERSFRTTLLGLRHGVDVARLLREVALRTGEIHLLRYCDELLAERTRLLAHAEQALGWFAEQPAIALSSGSVVAGQLLQAARCSTSSVAQPNASHSASATPIMRSSSP